MPMCWHVSSCVCICMHFCMSEHQLLCAGEQLWEQFCPQTSKRDTIYSDWLLQTCTAAGHLSRGSRLVSNQSDAPARVTGCAASWQQPIIAWLHSNARSSCLLAAQCDNLSCLTHQAEPSLQLPEVLALECRDPLLGGSQACRICGCAFVPSILAA